MPRPKQDRDAVAFSAELQRLRQQKLSGHPVASAPLGPFPELDPDEDHDVELALYLDLLTTYPFDPPLSYREKLEQAVEAVLTHGRSYAARAMSLAVGSGSAGPYSSVDVLGYLSRRPLGTAREIDQAGWLVDYLLDDPTLVPDVIESLRGWPRRADLVQVLRDEADRLPPDLVP
jgi:hypothetical protein